MFKIQITDENKGTGELSKMDMISNQTLAYFIGGTKRAYDSFWFGEVSPKIKVQLLGTEAISVFTASAQAQAFIKLMKPDYVELTVPNGYEVIWNEDGSAEIIGEYIKPEIMENIMAEEE